MKKVLNFCKTEPIKASGLLLGACALAFVISLIIVLAARHAEFMAATLPMSAEIVCLIGIMLGALVAVIGITVPYSDGNDQKAIYIGKWVTAAGIQVVNAFMCIVPMVIIL